MKLQDILTHGETVTVQLSAIAANQQASAYITARVERVGKLFRIGPFSLFGEIEVEIGEWYAYCVTVNGPRLERTLTGRMGTAILVVWQREVMDQGRL